MQDPVAFVARQGCHRGRTALGRRNRPVDICRVHPGHGVDQRLVIGVQNGDPVVFVDPLPTDIRFHDAPRLLSSAFSIVNTLPLQSLRVHSARSAGSQDLSVRGVLFDLFPVEFNAQTGTRRDLDQAVFVDHEWGGDNILDIG